MHSVGNEYKQLRYPNNVDDDDDHDDNIDVEKLVNHFAKYLLNIHKNCIFSKFDLDNPQPRLFKYPGLLWYNNVVQSHDDNDYYTLILANLNFLIDSNINKVDYIINNLLPHLKKCIFGEDDNDDNSSNISTSKNI